MPSKKLKSRPPQFHLWKAEQNCSEQSVLRHARELAGLLNRGDRVLLSGLMGAGKTTFARALLESLGVRQPPEGSPSFAIAHEYETAAKGGVVHIDFYRLKHEAEIDDAGIPAYFWERDLIVICEWATLFKEFESQIVSQVTSSKASRAIWKVELEITSEASRNLLITMYKK